MAVIPARGGSKGLLRKNIQPLNGRPLISYIIQIAKAASSLDKVIVSTEDEEIAQIAEDWGAEVPFTRPESLSRDDTPWVPVLQHAIQTMSEDHGYHADAVVTLQATTPFLTSSVVDQCVESYRSLNVDSVVTVCKDSRNFKQWQREGTRFTPLFDLDRQNRQWEPERFRENGFVYVSSRELLLDRGILTSDTAHVVVMEGRFVDVDIHDEVDLVVANSLLRTYGSKAK